MKRAAGQIRKVRRNKVCDKDSNDDGPNQNGQAHHQPARRKPTPEEAALTAKNYRLAKELSDLRVRNREECKAVSRLTMENMNLASRWREAIGHVAMLKKELAMHQRRAAEVFAQRKAEAERNRSSSESTQHNPNQTPSKPSSIATLVDQSPENTVGGTSLQDVAAEMDRMDRILAAHQAQSGSEEVLPAPLPLPKDAAATPMLGTPSDAVRDYSTVFHSLSCTDHEDREEKKTQSMDQPVTPSPRKENDDGTNYDGGGADKEEDDEFDLPQNREYVKEDFFSIFTGGNQVAFDGIQVDDPPLACLSLSVMPSVSPPSSPPHQNDLSPESIADSHKAAMQEFHKIGPPLFPMTASPKPITKTKVFNKEFPCDISLDIMRHPRSAEQRTTSKCNGIAEEESTAMADVRTQKPPPPPPLSGIDAFEASFATPFPDSFSPSEDTVNMVKTSLALKPNTEEYNPFFPSLSKDEAENTSEESPGGLQLTCTAESDSSSISSSIQSRSCRGQADNMPALVLAGRPRSAGLSTCFATSYNCKDEVSKKQKGINEMGSSVNSCPRSEGMSPRRHSSHSDNSYDRADSPSQSKTIGRIRYETPPQNGRSPESVHSDGPKRPEKAGAAAARARYEKALQPRGFAGTGRLQRRTEWDAERGARRVDESVPSAPSAYAPFGKKDEGNHETGSHLHVNRSKIATVQARVKERTAAYTGRAEVTPGMEDTSWNKGFGSVGQNQWASRPSPNESVASKPWDEEIGDITVGMSAGKSKKSALMKGQQGSGINGHNSSVDIQKSDEEIGDIPVGLSAGKLKKSALMKGHQGSGPNGHNASVDIRTSDEEIGDIPLGLLAGKPKKSALMKGHQGSGLNGRNASVDIRTSAGTSYFLKKSPLIQSPRSSIRRQSITHDRPWESRSNEEQDLPSMCSYTPASSAVNYVIQQEDSGKISESVTSRFIAAGKSRRRVKQPVSYAEPSLNSKLRRGDVYFPKSWDSDDTEEMRSHVSSIVHL